MSNILEIEDFFQFKKIKRVKTIDNENVLFEEERVEQGKDKYASAIYLLNTKTIYKQQFTLGLTKDSAMELSHTKDKLAFLSSREGEESKPQLYIMQLDGGEAIKKTSMKNGVNSFNWSFDDHKIAFIHRVNMEEQEEEEEKEEEEKAELSAIEKKIEAVRKEEKGKKKKDPRIIERIVYRQGTSFLDDRYAHIYILDLEEKKSKRITSGEVDYFSPIISPDGSKIYASKRIVEDNLNDTRKYIIVEIDIETKEEKELLEVFGWQINVNLTADGTWLIYNCSISEEDLSLQNQDLKALNLDTLEQLWISEEIDNHAVMPIIVDEMVYFRVDNWDHHEIYQYNLNKQELTKVISQEAFIYDFDIDKKHTTIIMNISNKQDPSNLLLYKIQDKESSIVYSSNKEWLQEKKLATSEEIRYTGFNNKEVQGWIVKPPNFDENKKYPLLLEIHGGPSSTWSPYERTMWHEFQMYAAKDYVIFYCNPRGSSGRGLEFRNVKANWGEEPATDILSGLDIVMNKEFVDRNNVFVTGGSYGGYMTAWIIGHDFRFTAAAPQRGVYNLISFAMTTDITNFTKEQMGYQPWEKVDVLWDQSPIAYVDKVQAPTRVIHSENDFRVPISQGEEYFASLVKNKVEADFVRYPEEGHELSRSGKPSRLVDRLNKIYEWFEKYKK